MKRTWKKGMALTLTAAALAGSLAGCGNGKANENTQTGGDSASGLEEVTLTWYIPGNGPQADTDKVEDAIYEYLKDDLNVRVNFVECDWGSYDDKVQMAIASQEAFDLCYTAHWSNNFYNNVSKNAFLELNDLLDEYGQDLKKLIPEEGWKAATVNGNIYAVPNMQIWAYQGAVGVETDVLEKYDFDLTTVKSLEDMEPLFEKIKADNPDIYPIVNCGPAELLNNYQNTLGFEELAGSKIPGALVYGDDEMKVVNQFELPQVQDFFQMMYEWNQKGYFRSDSATVTDENMDIQAGKSVSKLTSTYKPGVETDTKAKTGKDFTYQQIGTAHLSTSSITAALTAVSRTSKNPERAMMFLNRVNTDPELYNLICFGIEGVHYTKEGNYAIPVENSAYNPNQDWVYGDQFNALYREGQGENDWELTEEINNSAEPSEALGFSFDSTSVQTQLASVSAVVDEYYSSLATGVVNPEEVLPEFLNKLEQAGCNDLIAECQKQLDEWVAENK
ncbi:hypothetical protein B5F07_14840 [Lachnoclostridium sp. An169]|uniref:ABC transporter substrate-binding protein n=1 Tax=Lachnoclostridium sp. An169 TaxID=1965569 RepID=UPI000B36875A|nr:ABC transporter substrate-binding protein [Lachnoclostridium sp. An169]OUP82198.1 hypothetical protein B5F07_14840 [Lachnoclostridium sp. An169]HJA68007.1 ABC transporter substrate-binding protein [Candidatus Mediterraneibacter cottocaccae]